MTAMASLPSNRLTFLLASQLIQILETPGEAAWGLAAMAAATPYLFFERADLWDRLARRILDGEGGAIAARALARGLSTLWRRGVRTSEVEMPLRDEEWALRYVLQYGAEATVVEPETTRRAVRDRLRGIA